MEDWKKEIILRDMRDAYSALVKLDGIAFRAGKTMVDVVPQEVIDSLVSEVNAARELPESRHIIHVVKALVNRK